MNGFFTIPKIKCVGRPFKNHRENVTTIWKHTVRMKIFHNNSVFVSVAAGGLAFTVGILIGSFGVNNDNENTCVPYQ